ncbi:MAG: TetM/TetW/TetO/TetS family tetracycline resistance ribosomal protection protein [Clostridium sp.]
MKKLAVGILAHVDAGKTTLSEALLYVGGSIRKPGRVDKGDAFLDTFELEKKRGITIFSKQAILRQGDRQVTLLDTPGHVDFSAEAERTLQVLDYAILVISGVDGVQGHTHTLWKLLSGYRVPTFLFINKMDLAGTQRATIMCELKQQLNENCIDFAEDHTDAFYENIALCGEDVLERFLETGRVETQLIGELIRERKLFPCYFGSALKLDGVEAFFKGMGTYMEPPEYPNEFGAKVFKIVRDQQGNRLTYMKITGGCLRVKDVIGEEKVNQIRIYSGEKYDAVAEAQAGTVCAVLGLTKTTPGEGLGITPASNDPVLEPVLTYRLELPEGIDAASILPKLNRLEEEEPELHLIWEAGKKEIHVQIMGEIQMEVLKSLIAERFGIDVELGGRSIVYKETIKDTVEGVGHFEPLRHYAEVHLLMEPGRPGSGLSFSSACSEDVLDKNWQHLVLTHLAEKEHKGVLTGAAITDMKITLMSGRAHIKHTEGGDFRQAVYRAVRQGLQQAQSVLLEPFYEFSLEVPEKMLGRAMNDMEKMHGVFTPPRIEHGMAILSGKAPVACIDGYRTEVVSYTGGQGRLSCVMSGYAPCHNAEEVIAAAGYEAESDQENPSYSVFCTHGAGFPVAWNEVKHHMHLKSCLEPMREGNREGVDGNKDRNVGDSGQLRRESMGTDEVNAILERTYYSNSRDKSGLGKKRWGNKGNTTDTAAMEISSANPPEVKASTAGTYAAGAAATNSPIVEYLLVDGYNIIFAWEELKELADINMDSAKGKLLDILCNYQGITKCNLIVVFDAYRVLGHVTEYIDYHNIHVVYTKEAETADQYIEKFAHENGRKYHVTVATSDRLEQIIIQGQGCHLISARELEKVVERMREEIHMTCEKTTPGGKRYLLDAVSEETMEQVKKSTEY